ncbi:hypothetical protein BV898_16767 [Hypsibius exemplaris]|uniref:Uncharacterized protein n=1 Tax=Hypsibius exemplaris TaxID=2072580 RepID=A0A9X6RLJ1_HYPEX|nr:hypothetical protein BV898_16767 [Hypsibius exemplaris]
MPGRKVTRRIGKSKSRIRIKPILKDDTPKEVVWSVSNVSVIRSPDQVTNPDEILQRLLDEAELNLRWEKFYAQEECVIQPQGIRFINRTLYRRLEIVTSYLHALRTRKQRERKSVESVPNPLFVEVTLIKSDAPVEGATSDSPVVVPFSAAFRSRREALAAFADNEDCYNARFLIKLSIRAARASQVQAVVEENSPLGEEEQTEAAVEGSDEWLQTETAILKADADYLFERTTKVVVADISVVMLKPVTISDLQS